MRSDRVTSDVDDVSVHRSGEERGRTGNINFTLIWRKTHSGDVNETRNVYWVSSPRRLTLSLSLFCVLSLFSDFPQFSSQSPHLRLSTQQIILLSKHSQIHFTVPLFSHSLFTIFCCLIAPFPSIFSWLCGEVERKKRKDGENEKIWNLWGKRKSWVARCKIYIEKMGIVKKKQEVRKHETWHTFSREFSSDSRSFEPAARKILNLPRLSVFHFLFFKFIISSNESLSFVFLWLNLVHTFLALAVLKKTRNTRERRHDRRGRKKNDENFVT